MEDYLKDTKWVCGFEKPQTDPSAFERPATTVLSPYLKFGCLSPRLFHSRLVALYRVAKGTHSKPPVSLRGQLLWREFFYTVGWEQGGSRCQRTRVKLYWLSGLIMQVALLRRLLAGERETTACLGSEHQAPSYSHVACVAGSQSTFVYLVVSNYC